MQEKKRRNLHLTGKNCYIHNHKANRGGEGNVDIVKTSEGLIKITPGYWWIITTNTQKGLKQVKRTNSSLKFNFHKSIQSLFKTVPLYYVPLG